MSGQPESIDAAIDEYASRAGSGDPAESAPYDSGSLAEIYAPRVRELLDLQAAGFTHARWAFDPEQGVNRWHGVG